MRTSFVPVGFPAKVAHIECRAQVWDIPSLASGFLTQDLGLLGLPLLSSAIVGSVSWLLFPTNLSASGSLGM